MSIRQHRCDSPAFLQISSTVLPSFCTDPISVDVGHLHFGGRPSVCLRDPVIRSLCMYVPCPSSRRRSLITRSAHHSPYSAGPLGPAHRAITVIHLLHLPPPFRPRSMPPVVPAARPPSHPNVDSLPYMHISHSPTPRREVTSAHAAPCSPRADCFYLVPAVALSRRGTSARSAVSYSSFPVRPVHTSTSHSLIHTYTLLLYTPRGPT